MDEVFHNLLLGVGSVFLGPTGKLPMPQFKVTPPALDAKSISRDFAVVSRGLSLAINKVANEKQLALGL